MVRIQECPVLSTRRRASARPQGFTMVFWMSPWGSLKGLIRIRRFRHFPTVQLFPFKRNFPGIPQGVPRGLVESSSLVPLFGELSLSLSLSLALSFVFCFCVFSRNGHIQKFECPCRTPAECKCEAKLYVMTTVLDARIRHTQSHLESRGGCHLRDERCSRIPTQQK